MFLRKLTVIVVPLLLCIAVILGLQLLNSLGFFAWAGGGLLLGIALAALLPLSGASRRREPFGALLWVPTVLLLLVIAYQYCYGAGVISGGPTLLATDQLIVVLTESAFVGFMSFTCIRTHG